MNLKNISVIGVKTKIEQLVGLDWMGRLDSIERTVILMKKKITPKKIRIMMGPSFVYFAQSYAFDKSLSMAFQLRGVEVIPTYCDSVQDEECQFIGGDWNEKGNFLRDCKSCKKTSEKLWKNNQKNISLSKYLSHEDFIGITSEVSSLELSQVLSYKKLGVCYGAIAKDILVNKYLVSTYTLIENHEHLIKVHLKNLLIVSLAYERILDEQKPDRVVSHDSFYGMSAILERHCKARSIPFYSHWPMTKNRILIAYNDAAINIDFKKSWGEFSKIDLNMKDDEKIKKWINGEREDFLDHANLLGHEIIEPELQRIDEFKPTIILAGNCIWDAAALNKQIIFDDMISWVVETIEWFRVNSNYQLIIRPHPGEKSPQIPKTKETIELGIKLHGITIPNNVFLLSSDAKVTIKDLIGKCNFRGFLIHTTTVGFEYAALGFPVITTAKSHFRGFGFTIDPTTKQEYFLEMKNLLVGDFKELSDLKKSLARKFIKFNWFHYYSNLGLFYGDPPKLAENYIELLMKEDGAFGYVVNSIIEGVAINDESRWIPET
jgi:hypothetical protein